MSSGSGRVECRSRQVEPLEAFGVDKPYLFTGSTAPISHMLGNILSYLAGMGLQSGNGSVHVVGNIYVLVGAVLIHYPDFRYLVGLQPLLK